MRLEHVLRLDLNLLVSLQSLIEERNVSRAAARVGLSQPAMSRALGRLRAHLGDSLLVRSGSAMSLTPRAEALAGPLATLLGDVEGLLGDRPTFDPSAAERTFRVATADYGAAVLIPPLVDRLSREAPNVTVEVQPALENLGGALERGQVDVALMPQRRGVPGVIWRRLFSDHFVCMVRSGHPRIGRQGLTLDGYCEIGHAVVVPSGRPGNPVDDALARRGRKRRIVLRLNSFLAAPLIVASSDLIATTPARIAARFAALPVVTHAPPLPIPGFTVALGWHERFRRDPGHAWFRRAVAETLHATLPASA